MVHVMLDMNNTYQFQDKCTYKRTERRTNRQTECIHTFQLYWKVLKIIGVRCMFTHIFSQLNHSSNYKTSIFSLWYSHQNHVSHFSFFESIFNFSFIAYSNEYASIYLKKVFIQLYIHINCVPWRQEVISQNSKRKVSKCLCRVH